jgi:polysaccharide transporter, PST family
MNLVRQSWPFALASVAVMIYMRVDQIMLREMAGERELGIYSAALPFSQALHFIPVVICASVLPTLARDHAEDRTLFFERLQKLFTVLAWVAIILVLGLILGADFLIATLLGPAYRESAPVLALHVVTNVFIFLGVAQGQWVLNERRPGVSLAKTLIGAAANVGANLILIPRHGALGAAMAAVLAQGVAAVLSNSILAPKIFVMQLSAIFPVRYLFRTAP